jgi:hypothetical protein
MNRNNGYHKKKLQISANPQAVFFPSLLQLTSLFGVLGQQVSDFLLFEVFGIKGFG